MDLRPGSRRRKLRNRSGKSKADATRDVWLKSLLTPKTSSLSAGGTGILINSCFQATHLFMTFVTLSPLHDISSLQWYSGGGHCHYSEEASAAVPAMYPSGKESMRRLGKVTKSAGLQEAKAGGSRTDSRVWIVWVLHPPTTSLTSCTRYEVDVVAHKTGVRESVRRRDMRGGYQGQRDKSNE